MSVNYDDRNGLGDHVWYVSGLTKSKTHYPTWRLSYGSVREIAEETYELNKTR